MTASKLADAPLDAPALEQELWRSVSSSAPQSPLSGAPAPRMPERPLAGAVSRPLPAPANQRIPAPANQSAPPAAPVRQPQLRAPATPSPVVPAGQAPAPQDAPGQAVPPRRPANDAAVAAQRRYDWNGRAAAPVEAPKPVEPSNVDKAVAVYASIARQVARLARITTPRRWAYGAAGAAIVAVLGVATVGMTLLFDSPHEAAQPARTAQSAPVEAAPVQQAPARENSEPAPQTVAAVAAPPAVHANSVPANGAAALLQPQATPVASVQALETNDARWARDHEPAAAQADQQDTAAPQQSARGDGPDSATTSGIVPVKPAKADNVLADDQQAAAAEPPAAKATRGGANGSSGTTTMAVKMRAKESNDANVVAVLPARASVEVLGCKAWCKVSYNGQEGFIYKRFVKR